MNADIMSDMTTFTARELDRETSRVLDRCDQEGAVQVRRKNGRSYTISANRPVSGDMTLYEWMKERRRKTKELFQGQPPMTKKEAREFDRMIAGE